MKDKISKQFSVKVKERSSNKVVVIDIIAKDQFEAKAIASKQGIVLSIKRNRGIIKAGLTSAERFIFLTKLSAMLGSSMGVADALCLLRDNFTGSIRNISHQLHGRVNAGQGLDAAMKDVGEQAFPSAIVALVSAGFQGSGGWRSLQEAADFEVELDEIKKDSGRGLWGAIFMFLMAVATLVGSTLFLSPMVFELQIFQDYPEVLEQIWWVNVIADVTGWFMGVVFIIFVLLLLLNTVVKGVLPILSDKIIMKIPYYKDMVLAKNSYSTLYALSLLIKSGVRVEDSIKITMESSPKGALKNDLSRAYDFVVTGRPWADAMTTLHPTDRATLKIAQNREQTADSLGHLSRQYRRLYAQRVRIMIPTLMAFSMLLLVICGAIIFGQVVWPILILQSTIGQ